MSTDKQIGRAANPPKLTFVMTERKAHEAWAKLTLSSPRAAMLLHVLVARIGPQNMVVASQKTLAKLVGCNERTIRRAIADLVEGCWIQRLCIGGTVHGYVVNSQVVWGENRGTRGMTVFDARIIIDQEDQDKKEAMLDGRQLRRIPLLTPPDEIAFPDGEGEPGANGCLPGMEPVLHRGDVDLDQPDLFTGETMRDKLEAEGEEPDFRGRRPRSRGGR